MDEAQKSYDDDIKNIKNTENSENNSELINDIIDNDEIENKKIKAFFSRSTLTFDEMLQVILWKKKQNNNEKIDNKKILAPKIAELLSKEFNKKVTVDIVKSLWSCRTKLTEKMFNSSSIISYQEYLQIINFE